MTEVNKTESAADFAVLAVTKKKDSQKKIFKVLCSI